MSGLEVLLALGLITGSLAAPSYPETATSVDCPTIESVRSFPHPTNCSKYYQCENGTKVEKNCTNGFYYSTATRVCESPRYGGCKMNGSLPITSGHSPVDESETKNDSRTILNKEDLTPKIESRNATLKTNGIVANNPIGSKYQNVTLKRVLEDLTPRRSSSNNSSVYVTRPATNSSVTTSGGNTTGEAIVFKNDTKSTNKLIGVTNSYNGTTPGTEEITTEDSSQNLTESSTGRGIVKKVNVTTGTKLKILDRIREGDTESNERVVDDDTSESETEEDGKDNEKPLITKRQ